MNGKPVQQIGPFSYFVAASGVLLVVAGTIISVATSLHFARRLLIMWYNGLPWQRAARGDPFLLVQEWLAGIVIIGLGASMVWFGTRHLRAARRKKPADTA